MRRKYISILLTLILISIVLAGCYDANGVETYAYVIAIGIDRGTNNVLKISFQFALPTTNAALSSGSNGKSSSQSSSSSIMSVECSTIDSGINLLNSYISKKVNLSHCKAIIVSEDLAYDGVSEYIYTLVNNIEIRPDCNVIVSRCNSYDFLENSKPNLENLSARYYDLISNASEYSGYSDNIVLAEFYANILDDSIQASAVLGGLNLINTELKESNAPSYNIDGNYKADQAPIEDGDNVQNVGLAVFNGDKLVGEINSTETMCYLIINNNLKNTTISIPSPFNKEDVISLSIKLTNNTKKDVEFINGFPYIKCQIYVTGNILSINNNIDYSNSDNLKIIEEYVNTYLETNISSYLYKTSKEFKSDINGFGRIAKEKYLTVENWENSSWLDNYRNSFFNIEVKSVVQSSYLFNKV